jgi:hypothetical protein
MFQQPRENTKEKYSRKQGPTLVRLLLFLELLLVLCLLLLELFLELRVGFCEVFQVILEQPSFSSPFLLQYIKLSLQIAILRLLLGDALIQGS